MADEAPRVHLIDAHVYLFRAYFALPEMRAPDGTPVAAAYGFANTLLRYLRASGLRHGACAFDHSLRSFRNELEPGYKASRLEPPPDLAPQFALAREAARALGLAAFEVEGFEADDCIATLATGLAAEGCRVVVVSADKDLAQLVTEDASVVVHDLARGTTLDADGVRARFGVSPAQIPDLLGLVGDAVDELPGVPGIGPRTAAAALRAFGTIQAIPSEPAAWAGTAVRGAARAAARIAEHRARALRTRELATLRRDVPGLRVPAAELLWRGADRGAVRALFGRLGWERIATRVPHFA